VLIVDTAGRLHIDDQLMDEMQSLKKLLNPTEILFVADAMNNRRRGARRMSSTRAPR
jgi:signal recognition particle subunit SRP54